MKILLINDDGVLAEGIKVLAEYLEKDHEVIIVAPNKEKSGESHSITLHKKMTVKKIKINGIKAEIYSLDGMPADCARVGLKYIAEDIDLVISGINRGYNSGYDVLYSGTVSAAIEANVLGYPSIAISAAHDMVFNDCNYDIAAKVLIDILEKYKYNIIRDKLVININVPYIEENAREFKICSIGDLTFHKTEKGYDEDNNMYIIAKGRERQTYKEDTDRYWLEKGYSTITPLFYNYTNYEKINELNSI